MQSTSKTFKSICCKKLKALLYRKVIKCWIRPSDLGADRRIWDPTVGSWIRPSDLGSDRRTVSQKNIKYRLYAQQFARLLLVLIVVFPCLDVPEVEIAFFQCRLCLLGQFATLVKPWHVQEHVGVVQIPVTEVHALGRAWKTIQPTRKVTRPEGK